MIYLDYASSTPVEQEVLESFVQIQQRYFANADAMHTLGFEAQKILQAARLQVAQLLNVEEKTLIFTSGATEANNLAIQGVAKKQKKKKHIITSNIEHASVSDVLKYLEQNGFEITYLPVNNQGLLTVEQILQALRADTFLISLIHVHNELGTVQDIEEIAAAVKRKAPDVIIHSDMAQSVGKQTIQLKNIDLATFSGQKIFAPKGIGLLYKKESLQLVPLFFGGNQENRLKPGTLPVPLIGAFAKAMRLLLNRNQRSVYQLNGRLRTFFAEFPDVFPLIQESLSVPHILSVYVGALACDIETFIRVLSEQDVFVSTRSSCHSKDINKGNPVIEALGLTSSESRNVLRISLSYLTTEQDMIRFMDIFRQSYDLYKI